MAAADRLVPDVCERGKRLLIDLFRRCLIDRILISRLLEGWGKFFCKHYVSLTPHIPSRFSRMICLPVSSASLNKKNSLTCQILVCNLVSDLWSLQFVVRSFRFCYYWEIRVLHNFDRNWSVTFHRLLKSIRDSQKWSQSNWFSFGLSINKIHCSAIF